MTAREYQQIAHVFTLATLSEQKGYGDIFESAPALSALYKLAMHAGFAMENGLLMHMPDNLEIIPERTEDERDREGSGEEDGRDAGDAAR